MVSKKERKNILILVTIVLLAATLPNIYFITHPPQPNTTDHPNSPRTSHLEMNQLDHEIIIKNDNSEVLADSQPMQNTAKQKQQMYVKENQLEQVQQKIDQQVGDGDQNHQYEENSEAERQENEIKFLNKNQMSQEDLRTMSRQRIKMGQPKSEDRLVRLWIIAGSPRSYTCSIMNAINILTVVSVQTIKCLATDMKIGNIIVFTDRLDSFASQLIRSNFDPNTIHSFDTQIDSDYQFVRYATSLCKCEKILYLSHHIKFRVQAAAELEHVIAEMRSFQILHSTKAVIKDIQTPLQNLSDKNFQGLGLAELSKYVFVFDSRYLGIITPLNFAFFSKYTIQQLIIVPILCLAQKINMISPFTPLLHTLNVSKIHFKQFSLKQPSQQSNSLCFVSYPSNPTKGFTAQLKSYLSSLHNLDLKGVMVSLIVFLPYSLGSDQRFVEIVKLLFDIKNNPNVARVRVRLRASKAVSSLSNFQSSYTYCPQNTTIISSRQNINFHERFAVELIKHVSAKYHYYVTKFTDEDNTKTFISQSELSKIGGKLRLDENLHKYFQPVQIFKSNLLKSLFFWAIKSTELDFFEASAAYFIPLLEMVSFSVKTIDQNLFSVHKRQKTETQSNQIQRIKRYREQKSLVNGELQPIPYDCLDNYALRRNQNQLIPKIIHLMNISGDLDQRRLQNIKLNHPDFKIRIWSQEDVTEKQFPFTYSFTVRLKCSLHHEIIATNLLAYEALLNYGGIYFQQATTPLRSFQSFLKYKMFFTRAISSGEIAFTSLSQEPIIGMPENSYFLKLLIHQTLNVGDFLTTITGLQEIQHPLSIRCCINDEEIFLQSGMGFNLFHATLMEAEKCATSLCKEYPKESYAIISSENR